MREIRFRSRNIKTKDWVYGHLFYFDDGRYFISPKGVDVEGDNGDYEGEYVLRGVSCVEVEPETVGQFTGLKDANGVEIYEGDIVRVTDIDSSDSYVTDVYWGGEEYPAFDLNYKNIPNDWFYESNVLSTINITEAEEIEVIGNIYEDKKLLEEE